MERYKKELNVYKNSTEYQEFLKTKKQHNQTSVGILNEFLQPMDGTSFNVAETDDMSVTNDDLYCKDCDIYFHNLHNKTEHMKGREHRKNNISNNK